MTVEKLTEQRDGQNVIALRQDGKRRWAIASAGMGEKSTRFLYGEYADKLAEYEAIGTPEECRAAVEKQKAKKPPVVNRPSIFVKVPVCPNCSTQEHYQPLYGKTKYCSNCGQKLDWSDEE